VLCYVLHARHVLRPAVLSCCLGPRDYRYDLPLRMAAHLCSTRPCVSVCLRGWRCLCWCGMGVAASYYRLASCASQCSCQPSPAAVTSRRRCFVVSSLGGHGRAELSAVTAQRTTGRLSVRRVCDVRSVAPMSAIHSHKPSKTQGASIRHQRGTAGVPFGAFRQPSCKNTRTRARIVS
jgi:hypothetical protein